MSTTSSEMDFAHSHWMRQGNLNTARTRLGNYCRSPSSGDMQKLPTVLRAHKQNLVKFAAEFRELSCVAPAIAGAQEGSPGC